MARPPRLLAESWGTLLVLAHHGEPFVAEDGRTVDQVAQVRARVAGLLRRGTRQDDDRGLEPRAPSRGAARRRPRAARPRGVLPAAGRPRLDGRCRRGQVLPARQLGRSGHRRCEGWLRVFCGPVVIAESRLELPVHRDGPRRVRRPAPTPIPRYRRIFPCFDRADAAVVEGVAAVAEALGDDYLDRVVAAQQDDAPSGWLLPLIDEADVFQLFWSSHSMVSPACREQWEHALATPKDGSSCRSTGSSRSPGPTACRRRGWPPWSSAACRPPCRGASRRPGPRHAWPGGVDPALSRGPCT